MRQIEETSEHIIVLAGPISYLLASDAFDAALGDILRESIPDTLPRPRARARAGRRSDGRAAPAQGQLPQAPARHRQPDLGAEMEHFLRNGLVGRLDLPEKVRRERRALRARRPSTSPR